MGKDLFRAAQRSLLRLEADVPPDGALLADAKVPPKELTLRANGSDVRSGDARIEEGRARPAVNISRTTAPGR